MPSPRVVGAPARLEDHVRYVEAGLELICEAGDGCPPGPLRPLEHSVTANRDEVNNF